MTSLKIYEALQLDFYKESTDPKFYVLIRSEGLIHWFFGTL